MKTLRLLSLVALCVLLACSNAHANVYATDIQLNGSLTTITNATNYPVTISYHLNQPATLGVTVTIFQGGSQIATFAGGTNMGLNSVVWNAGMAPGTYSLSVSAAASGFTNWEQISDDTNAGNYAYAPGGIAVDNNTNSLYYGRVVLGCYADGAANGTNFLDGIYKLNADGSFADEGGFGYGGYTRDDYDETSSGEMPSESGVVPWKLRIGEDDRIYMLDLSAVGAIVAFDMRVTTNQVVIDDGAAREGTLGGPHNYSRNPDLNDLVYGINNFDVSSTTTTNAAVWLCDGDSLQFNGSPNWGIWMYHLKNGASDPNDTLGTQVVTTGGDLSQNSSGGCMVDTNLDIFCGQRLPGETAAYDAMVFSNWHGGVLPLTNSGTSNVLGAQAGTVLWGYGCGVGVTCGNDPTFEAVNDIVINSRKCPTIVACPTGAGADDSNGSGIRLLNATNGFAIITNLDFGQQYACAAWDNVGNLYGASPTRNVWRVWSPPGANSNTNVALAHMVLTIPFTITGITASPTTPGCANVAISFTAPGNLAPSTFTLVGSSAVNGPYSAVAGAVITGGSGTYQAAFSNCSTTFYKIMMP